jgi:hypothetical protein
MAQEVLIEFPGGEHVLLRDGRAPEEGADVVAARWWLDRQYVALGCVPKRASGKVMSSEKALAATTSAPSSGARPSRSKTCSPPGNSISTSCAMRLTPEVLSDTRC